MIKTALISVLSISAYVVFLICAMALTGNNGGNNDDDQEQMEAIAYYNTKKKGGKKNGNKAQKPED